MTDTNTCETLQVAEWVDATLNETLNETLSHHATRVFAVYHTADGFERRLIDTDPDPYAVMLKQPKLPTDIDGSLTAGCFVMTGWMTKVQAYDENDEPIDEDDEDTERIRVRVIAAVNTNGVSTVVRRFGPDGTSDSFADGGEGMFPDAIKIWWLALTSV